MSRLIETLTAVLNELRTSSVQNAAACAGIEEARQELQLLEAAKAEEKLFYTVKPYTWAHGMQGRSGTIYQIIEQRTIATSKVKDDADTIVEALNGHRRLKRENSHLMARAAELEKRSGVSVQMVQAVLKAEAQKECRWSSTRLHLEQFGERVMARIHAALD